MPKRGQWKEKNLCFLFCLFFGERLWSQKKWTLNTVSGAINQFPVSATNLFIPSFVCWQNADWLLTFPFISFTDHTLWFFVYLSVWDLGMALPKIFATTPQLNYSAITLTSNQTFRQNRWVQWLVSIFCLLSTRVVLQGVPLCKDHFLSPHSAKRSARASRTRF